MFLLSDFLWNYFMIIFLLGIHIYMSIKTGFIQKKTFYAIRLSLEKKTGEGKGISPFQALCTSLAASLGTGNIIGVGTAIFLGGAGAVFWCWIAGVLGIATKYAESLIAAKYRIKRKDGSACGGAMYVLKTRLGYKKLAFLFAFSCVMASLGVGCGVQINAIGEVLKLSFIEIKINPLAVGMFFSLMAAVVIMGGIKSIGKVCEKLIPFITVIFLLGNIVILILNIKYIPESINLIFKSAFSFKAVQGGAMGYGAKFAIRYGISRGLFSNEAGMGSGAISGAASVEENPVKSALVSATAVFWDTVVLMLVTGIAVVSGIVRCPEILLYEAAGGTGLAARVFNQIPLFGNSLITLSVIVFAFSTVLGWEYYGQVCFEYLTDGKKSIIYKLVFILTGIFSAGIKADVIWAASDILNAFMAIFNVVSIIMLAPEIKADTKKYLNTLKIEKLRINKNFKM